MLTNQLSTRELLGSRRFYRRNSQGDRPQYGSNSQTQSSQAGSSEGMYSQMVDSQSSDLLFPQQQDSEGSVNYYQRYKAQSALFPTQGARQPISVVKGCPQMSLQEQMEVNRKRAKERDDREILNLFVSMLKDCVEEVKVLTTGIQDKIDKTAATQGEKAEQLLQKVTDELGKHAGKLQDAVKRREEDKAKLSDLEIAMAAKDAEISQLKQQLKKALAAKEDNIISTLTSTMTKQQELTREQLSKLKDKENDNTEVLKESIRSCGEISRQLKQLEQQTKEREEAEKKTQTHNCCKDKGQCDSNYSEKKMATSDNSSKEQNVSHQNQQWSTAVAQREQWYRKQQNISTADPLLQNVPLKDDEIPVILAKQHSYGLQPNLALSSIYTGNQLSSVPAVSANTLYSSYHPTPVVVNPTTVQVGMSSALTRAQSEAGGTYGFGGVTGTLQNPHKNRLQQNMVEIKPRKPCNQENILQQNNIPSTRIVGQNMDMANDITSEHPAKDNNQHQGQHQWLRDPNFQHHGQTNRHDWNGHQSREVSEMTNQNQGQRGSDVDSEYGMLAEFGSRPTNQHQSTTMSTYHQQHAQLPPLYATSTLQPINKQVGMTPNGNGLVRDNEVYQLQVGDAQPVFSPDIKQVKSGVRKQSPIATVLPQSSEELPAWRQYGRYRKRSRSCTDLSKSGSEEKKATIRDKPASVKRRAKMGGNKTPASAKGSYKDDTLATSSTGQQHMKIVKAIQMWRPNSSKDVSKRTYQNASVYDFDDHEDVPGIKPAIRSAKRVSKPQNNLDTRLKCIDTPEVPEDVNLDSDKREVKQYVSPYSDVEEPESDDPYEEDVDENSDENLSNTFDDRREDTFENVLQFSKQKNPPSKILQSQDSEEEPIGSEAEGVTQESVDPLSLHIFSQERKIESDSPSLKKTLAIAEKWAVGKSAKAKENKSQVVSDQHQLDSDSSSSPSLWIMEDFFKPGLTRDVKPLVSGNTTQGSKRKGQLTMNINDMDPGSSQEDSQSQNYFSLKIPDSPVRPRFDPCNEQVVPDQSPVYATPQNIRQPPSPKVSRGSGLKRKLCDSSASWFVDASKACLKQLRSGSHRTAHK
ncbi:hypothetical protein Bbelb_058090 [Branchiostoma belcheri]|nr:hypothetical protein Bbelb_058090 [Branchiostoma belcheri]